MKDKDIRKLILASQGKCKLIMPYPRCHRGRYPFCIDGKTANVKKPFISCKE